MSSSGVDGVELAVLSNRVEGAVLSMMNTLLRTSRSGVINNGRDFSCCVLTADDELLAMAESQPIHVLAGPDLMARTMKEFHPRPRARAGLPAQLAVSRQLARGRSFMLVPVIDDDGVHRFTVLAKAHQADCGNSVPTTYMADARDVYEEGAVIFPCVKVQRGLSRHRGRHPDLPVADPRARAVVGRLPGGAGRGPDRRAAGARARRGGRLGRGSTRYTEAWFDYARSG